MSWLLHAVSAAKICTHQVLPRENKIVNIAKPTNQMCEIRCTSVDYIFLHFNQVLVRWNSLIKAGFIYLYRVLIIFPPGVESPMLQDLNMPQAGTKESQSLLKS